MESRVRIIDQTVNEALRLEVGTHNINLMMKNFQKYPIEFVDVDLNYLMKNCGTLEQVDLFGLMRCVVNTSEKEIFLAREMGFSKILITWTHHPKNLSLFKLFSALAVAKDFFEEIYLCIENASELSDSEMKLYWPIILEYGVIRLIYMDKKGDIDCFKTFETLKYLTKKAPCEIEYIGSNAYGLATANSLAAFKVGIKYIGAAVGGVGLCGNAAMEEVLMALKHLWKQKQIPDGVSLALDCTEILNYIGIKLPVDKAIIGKNVFAHESGIHVDGISKNPYLYEAIKPEEVGLTRKLIIGKHSGISSIKFKFLQWNLSLDQSEAMQILEKVKEIAVKQKSSLSDKQLHQLYINQHIVKGL